MLAACPELEFVIDGTERVINRPQDKAKRDEHYSGKKKRTTVKNNLITERRSGGKVKYLSETVEGKRHDKKLADDKGYKFPPGSKLWQDTGFQGYEPEHVVTFQPKKKPRGKELTPAEKERNRELSSERVIVEHHIGGVKRSRIVHDTFRNRKDDYLDLAAFPISRFGQRFEDNIKPMLSSDVSTSSDEFKQLEPDNRGEQDFQR